MGSLLKKQPFFSIMIPVHNRLSYLADALQSVLQQDVGDMQIKVVNDGGDDEHQLKIKRIISQFPAKNIEFYSTPDDVGLIGIFNTCISQAIGLWVHILHDDDLVLPSFYQRLQAGLEKAPEEVGAAFCRHVHFDERDQIIYTSPLERETPGVIDDWLERSVICNRVQPPAMVIKREVHEKLGGYLKEANIATDWEMWLRVASHYSVWYEPTILAKYRRHTASASSQSLAQGIQMADTRKVIEIAQSYLPASVKPLIPQAKQHYAQYSLNLAEQFLQQKHYDGVLANLRECVLFQPNTQLKTQMKAFVHNIAPLQVAVDLDTEAYQAFIQQLSAISGVKMPSSVLSQNVQKMRYQFAQDCLKIPSIQLPTRYQQYLQASLKAFLNTELHIYPLVKQEKNFAQQVLKIWLKKPQVNAHLLVVMLYYPAYQLPLKTCFSLELPSWWISDFFWYLLKPPRLFGKVGEANKYYAYVAELLTLLVGHAQQNPQQALWQQLAQYIADEVSFSMLYFTPASTYPAPVLRARAALLQFAAQLRGWSLAWRPQPQQRDKVRVGILAKHFAPGTETFSTLPLFEALDRQQFEVFLYATQSQPSALEDYCQEMTDKWTVLPADTSLAVQQIREDALDVMLLGTNVTASGQGGTALALHRLARVQITNFASPVTTGFSFVDYYLSGTLLESADNAVHYTEKLLRLEGAGYCFSYQAVSEPSSHISVPSREDWAKNPDTVVMMSGAFILKIIPEVLETWARILAATTDTVLVLYPFAPSWIDGAERLATAFTEHLQTVLKRHKVATERLIILPPLAGQQAVQACLRQADLYLDSFPYSGSHSTVDALLAGIPPVVIQGQCVRFNQAAAALMDINLTECIAEDEHAYEALAIKLAENPEWRIQLAEYIQEKMRKTPRFLNSQDYGEQLGKRLLNLPELQ